MPAQTDLVLSEFVFADLGATGFGNAPRLLGQNGFEAGGTFYTGDPTLANRTGFFTRLPPGTVCDSNNSCGSGPDTNFHAIIWNGTTPTDLGTLGGPVAPANAINNAGEVVGLSYLPDGSFHATI
jgi:uncharacterized membrane protein